MASKLSHDDRRDIVDLAEADTAKECKKRGIQCYRTLGNVTLYTDEAQEIFNRAYDYYEAEILRRRRTHKSKMMWIVATPKRDLSKHDSKAAAFKAARRYLRRGIGRRNMDVYGVKSQVSLDASIGIGYRIEETYDIRIREGRVVAQKYRADGSSIGRPYDLGSA